MALPFSPQRELRPRLCAMKKGPNGYGFNLHSDKSKPGQFIRAVDPDSPAEASGLRAQDRIVEVMRLACFLGLSPPDLQPCTAITPPAPGLAAVPFQWVPLRGPGSPEMLNRWRKERGAARAGGRLVGKREEGRMGGGQMDREAERTPSFLPHLPWGLLRPAHTPGPPFTHPSR